MKFKGLLTLAECTICRNYYALIFIHIYFMLCIFQQLSFESPVGAMAMNDDCIIYLCCAVFGEACVSQRPGVAKRELVSVVGVKARAKTAPRRPPRHAGQSGLISK